MKHIKNPFVIINTLLLAFFGLLVLNANADRLHLPGPIKQALAAVASITVINSTADKLAVFAAVNQIGDSIIQDNGTYIGLGGAPTSPYKAYVHGQLGVLTSIDIGGSGAEESGMLNVNRTGSNLAALGTSYNGSWRLILVPRLGAGGYNAVAKDNDVGIIASGGNLVLGQWNGTSGVRVTGGGLEVTGNITYTGSIGQSSDLQLKKNIHPITGALEQLLNLHGKEFEWKEPEQHGNLTGVQRGFIAQEVESVFPDWVSTGGDGHKILSVRGFEALTVEALRELKAENEALNARIQALEERMNASH